MYDLHNFCHVQGQHILQAAFLSRVAFILWGLWRQSSPPYTYPKKPTYQGSLLASQVDLRKVNCHDSTTLTSS